MRKCRTRALSSDERGATAIEFALIAPVFLAMLLGIFHLSLLGFTVASLNYAVEKGARCDAILALCPDASTYYYAPDPAPVFTVTKGTACGTSVIATVTYDLNVLIYQKSIPLSAAACFP